MFIRSGCRATRPLLWDFAQQTLPEGALERVEAHLRRCERCREEAADYRRMLRCVTALRAEAAPCPAGGWTALHKRLSAESPRRRLPAARFAAAGAGLACCAALALAWWWNGQGRAGATIARDAGRAPAPQSSAGRLRSLRCSPC